MSEKLFGDANWGEPFFDELKRKEEDIKWLKKEAELHELEMQQNKDRMQTLEEDLHESEARLMLLEQENEKLVRMLAGEKPLRWRTGPVPVGANGIGMEVYFELRDDCGHGLGTGEKKGGVWEGDWHFRKESILRWLPLSEILELIGGE